MVARVIIAQGLSSVGSSMSAVALAFMVYDLTGSVMHMGGILAASTLPLVVMAWLGGAVLDRHNARNVMVLADVARAVLIISLPFLALRAVGLVYFIAALTGVFVALFNPAQIKLIGELVEPGRLVRVNSYLGISRDGAELLGYLCGGVIASLGTLTILGYSVVGYTLAFVIDGVSFLVSAALLVKVRARSKDIGKGIKLRALVAESPAVLGGVWRRPALRTNLFLGVFGGAAVMMYVPNAYGLALDVFDRGSVGLAVMEVFMAVGLVLGGLFFSRLGLGGDKNGYVLISLLAIGLSLVGVSLSGVFWVSIVLAGMAALASVGQAVPSITMLQELPASPAKGRIIALRTSFVQLGVTAGFLFGGAIGRAIGIQQAFLVAGVATIVISLIIYLPYRLRASRRAKDAWTAALEAGASRMAARQMADQAAYAGSANVLAGGGTGAWVAAAAEAAVADDTGSGT